MIFDNGNPCETDKFTSDKAKQLAHYLQSKHNGFAVFKECRTNDTKDIVSFTIEAELAQIKVNNIRPDELIAVHFDRTDKVIPAVYALRDDFPRNISHLNLEFEGWSASLCLYDEAYRDVKPLWTPVRFIERIREWLKETAQGPRVPYMEKTSL